MEKILSLNAKIKICRLDKVLSLYIYSGLNVVS